MNVKEFLDKLKEIEKDYSTVYMWGSFGQPLTEAFIAQKAAQYPRYYTGGRQAHLRSLLGRGYFAFDCVGLIKGILWGWSGDATRPRGGAGYAVNDVPDINANTMIQRCRGVSADFTNIVPGSAVWLQGHIGIYIGDGLVIEATPGWQSGVQITNCANIRSVPGGKNRRWTSHGRLPWIDYTAAVPEWERLIREKMDSPDAWIAFVKDMAERPPAGHPVARWLPEFITKLGG